MLQGHAADAATEADAEHAACQALQHELSTTKAREQQLHGADTRARELQVGCPAGLLHAGLCTVYTAAWHHDIT